MEGSMTRRDWLPTLWNEWDDDVVTPFRALKKQLDAVFDDFDLPNLARPGTLPVRTNLSETPTEVRLTAELPGLDRDDIDVEIIGDMITIRGEKTSEEEETGDEEDRQFHRIERRAGRFERMLRLPFEIDPDKVTAEVRNGVLTVTIPKPAEIAKTPRRVAIKSAA